MTRSKNWFHLGIVDFTTVWLCTGIGDRPMVAMYDVQIWLRHTTVRIQFVIWEVKACNSYHIQVEQLDEEVARLRQALADKQEQETAMLQVLILSVYIHSWEKIRFLVWCEFLLLIGLDAGGARAKGNWGCSPVCWARCSCTKICCPSPSGYLSFFILYFINICHKYKLIRLNKHHCFSESCSWFGHHCIIMADGIL